MTAASNQSTVKTIRRNDFVYPWTTLAILLFTLQFCTACGVITGADSSYHEKFWLRYRLAGDRARLEKDYQTAASIYQSALKEAESFGESDLRFNETLNDLADAYAMNKQWDKASPLYRRAVSSLTISFHKTGLDSPAIGVELARGLSGLAVADRQQGKSSEELFRQALSIQKELLKVDALKINRTQFGSDHCKTLLGLAQLSCERADYVRAESMFKRALDCTKEFPAALVFDREIRESYATMLRQANRPEEASLMEPKSSSLPPQGAPENNPVTASQKAYDEHMKEGFRLVMAKDYDGARRKYMEARKFTQKPSTLALNLAGIGETYRLQGKLAEAQTTLEQAVKALEETCGPEDYFTANCRAGLAYCYSQQGNYEQAEQQWKRVVTTYEEKLPAGHPQLAEARNAYAEILRKNGKLSRAKEAKPGRLSKH